MDQICNIPRWQMLRESLDNLDYDPFVKAFEKAENAILLDVRTKEEFEVNAIKDAIHFDYLVEDLADQLEQLDQNKNYYVYCRTGRRSLRVCVLMKNAGFESIVNLRNGINEIA